MTILQRPIPKSSDRRAWLRSFNRYLADILEGDCGAEALALCAPLIEAAGGWQAPPPPPATSRSTGTGEGEVIEKSGPPLDENPFEPAHQVMGTPAGIYHRNPVAWEGRRFPDPTKMHDEPKWVLRYFAAEAMDGEDSDLLIAEPEEAGRWSPLIGEKRYGLMSLLSFDVLRGLRQAGILKRLATAEGRPVVWQIGPHGITARALKTKLPNATILVSCEPWEMVASVAFLRKTLPEARLIIAGDEGALGGAWTAADFVFVPTSLVDSLTPPRLDLVLDAMSLQLSPPAVVEHHIRRAYELGCLFAFCVSLYGEAPEWTISDPQPIIERFFWLHHMPVHPAADWIIRSLTDEGFLGRGYARRPEMIKFWALDMHYTMGWRRLKT